MTLMTAHRILIAAAIVFFLLYALWELFHSPSVGRWTFVRSGISTLASLGFLVYFRSLGKS